MGIKGAVRKIARKIVGMEDFKAQLDSLAYYFQSFHDISRFPPAQGPLRDLQEADALLIAIVGKVLKKHELKYWLDWGTLLGAMRHRGFIPWDDDIDLCIPREDYDKALKVLREELGSRGFEVRECSSWDGIGYRHETTGIWADLYPAEYCTLDAENPAERERLRGEGLAYAEKYPKRCKGNDREQIKILMAECFPEKCGPEEAKSVFYANEYREFHMTSVRDLYPLSEAEFEGYRLRVPGNPDAYLRHIYGEYMRFPPVGFPHHNEDGTGLADRAAKHGTDMKGILRELKEIYEKI